ncbi:MAG: DNA repair protein RecO [Endomicrobium sp.]|jgi:DNA repair protein RecO (recombination protein O)|nr:DNA repair protein RecO [Endomicrobium sp.]
MKYLSFCFIMVEIKAMGLFLLCQFIWDKFVRGLSKLYYMIKGLVLNAKTQSEHDKLITLYSYEWGKIQAIVPSAKKIAAKLSSATEPLTESEFLVFNTHFAMRSKVIGASIIKNNMRIKTDLNKNSYALYAAEISDKFTPFNLENSKKYDLIARIWEILETCKYSKRALIAFILRFLKLSGYAFSDYLQRANTFVSEDIKNTIKRLSSCSGDEVDCMCGVEDEQIWNCLESYLTNYIPRPLLSVFFKKIGRYGNYFMHKIL